MSRSAEVALAAVTPEQAATAGLVLDVIRREQPVGRSEIARIVGLGRAVVGERVKQLLSLGLIRQSGPGSSTGGRRALELVIANEAGHILAADLGATSVAIGIADLSGRILSFTDEPVTVAHGPDAVLGIVCERFDTLLHDYDVHSLWGIGVGLPGPVEFATGVVVSPPIMAGWDQFNVRGLFQSRYKAATWVDNDVNVMALAEARAGASRGTNDSIFIKVGTGIGAGLVTQGKLHRGARGAAGDIGHISVTTDPGVACACGNTGCLEALVGGAAIARRGEQIANDGRSSLLQSVVSTRGYLTAEDVTAAAAAGDREAHELIQDAGQTLGMTLAGLINFYNPDMVVIGGGVSQAGAQYLASIRETIYRRSLPLATSDLQVVLHSLGSEVGVTGCALMVLEQLMESELVVRWIADGSPRGLLA